MFRKRRGATRASLVRLSCFIASIAMVMAIALLVSTSHPVQGADEFSELRADFNSVPEGVQRYTGGLGIGDPTCFLRDVPGNEIAPTAVQHQMDGILGPELMSHTVTDKRDLTYTAKGHVMTAPFNVGGFQICDNPIGSFVQGDKASTFSVDISTAGVASRKWPLIWFILDGSLKTPLPGDPAFVDTVRDHAAEVSVPGSAIFFKPELFNGAVGWGGWRTDGDRFGSYWQPIPVAPDFIARTSHQFVMDGRAIEVWVGGTRLWREENVIPAAWGGQRVDVRLDFVDYNSAKEGLGPTTWHWDNVGLAGLDVQSTPGATSTIMPTDPSVPGPPARAPSGSPVPTMTTLPTHDPGTQTNEWTTSAVGMVMEGTDGAFATLAITATGSRGGAALVDVELFDENGKRAFQGFERVVLAPEESRTLTMRTPPLPVGGFTVKVGVFAPDWSDLQHWNDDAATFTVGPQL